MPTPPTGKPLGHSQAPNYDFGQAAYLDDSYVNPKSWLKTQELVPAVEGFAGNIERVRWLALLPATLSAFSADNWWLVAQACERVLGKVELIDLTDEERSRIPEVYAETWKIKRKPSTWPGGLHIPITPQDAAKQVDLLRVQTPEVALGVTAILGAMITGTWTAVETVCGDLWRAALDHHPHGLAELKGKLKKHARQKKPKGEGSVGEPSPPKTSEGRTVNDGKMIPINDLQKYNFNLSSRMGTVLSKRQKFDSLSGIRDAYRLAFWEDYAGVDDLLDSESLDDLSAVRNVLVHRAGVMDKKGNDDLKRADLKAGLQQDQPIDLDGPLVNSLVNPVIKTMVGLFRAVDEWIVQHPPKRSPHA